ncbi:MAG: hypothetical protein FWG34_09710 [Oscillospiraceae bacterium]|nr:hypothetical protein [Oscillospiraceae bacterium]
MTKPEKFLAFFLAVSLAFFCAFFASCDSGKNADGKNGVENDTAHSGGAPENEAAAESAPPKLGPDLPDSDFGGAPINFLVRSENYNWYWCSREIYASEENGEPLNDAVYRRNRYVEGKYNFEITEHRSDSPFNDAQKAAKSGDQTYDVFMLGLNEEAILAQNGYLANLYLVPHLNLAQPWWDQRAVKQLNIGGKLYYALGDINTQDNDSIFVSFFNKKLIADYALENPYHLVASGDWTLDKFNRMITDISEDLNGDGIMGVEDRYGQLGEDLGAYMIFAGAGGRITVNNSENYPELAVNSEKTSAIIDKMLVNMGNRDLTLLANDYSGKYNNPWDDLTRPMFKNSQGLFYTIGMGTGNLLRDMEMDFGVLPLPKFDKSQAEYYCPLTSGTASAVCIPIANDQPEFTGLALEAMAAESMYTVTEAYYDINFKNKNLRDEESIEMLKIILSSCSYDLGYMFNFGGLTDIFAPMAKKNANTFASDYEKKETAAQKAIDKLIENFAG